MGFHFSSGANIEGACDEARPSPNGISWRPCGVPWSRQTILSQSLDSPVMGARQLAPFCDDHIRSIQTLTLPAIFVGVEALHCLAGDHVIVVELLYYKVLPVPLDFLGELLRLRRRTNTSSPGHEVAVAVLVDRYIPLELHDAGRGE